MGAWNGQVCTVITSACDMPQVCTSHAVRTFCEFAPAAFTCPSAFECSLSFVWRVFQPKADARFCTFACIEDSGGECSSPTQPHYRMSSHLDKLACCFFFNCLIRATCNDLQRLATAHTW